jgi:hypothetical protein
VENVRDSTSLAHLVDVPLDFCHGPAFGGAVSKTGAMHTSDDLTLTSSVAQSPQIQTG